MENSTNIDLNELQKQKRDLILKSGKYVEVSILIPKDDNLDPDVGFECSHASAVTIAKAIRCMKDLEESLYKQDPILKLLVACMHNEFDAYKQDKNNNITKI